MVNTNKLIHETSPYLLQHAHNPVNWFAWGDEALHLAKKENKPILVSIGYAACHWCHVMERESFENEATAAIMNENFINIKIDREERPDLDHIYMDAVQAMTGSGGWPLNVFLTPEGKPFYGGTYFPPQRAYNRASWQETLHSISQAFKERRHEIDAQAENLTEHLLSANSFGLQKTTEEIINEDAVHVTFNNIMKSADKEWGGFGKAPKFPQTNIIKFLLRYHYVFGDQEALNQAMLSIDKMIEGGIYDQAGGGFARYSTDTEWLAPHFEKMLYDNALLVDVICEAYQLTKKERYREVIEETMLFIKREMLYSQNGFYAALDADSEGVEGKFYVWSFAEVSQLLGSNAGIFCEYYDITEEGNWEGTNILRVKKKMEAFAIEKNITPDKLRTILEKSKQQLLEERSKRIRPLLDDKIILGWNALMNSAYSKAFAATGINEYRELAVANMNFLLKNFSAAGSEEFRHTWKNDLAKYPAFLDDYAFLIKALLDLQEITADTKWLKSAEQITACVLENFSEEETGFFFYTSKNQNDIIIRKKEVYDAAVPSGNSVMAYNLFHLSVLSGKEHWKERSMSLLSSLQKAISQYPASFGNWACLFLEVMAGTNEIVVLCDKQDELPAAVLGEYIPHRVFMISTGGAEDYPLLEGKSKTSKPTIYLCRNYTCQPPVFSAKELIVLINKGKKGN